jgi:hypothetical protein
MAHHLSLLKNNSENTRSMPRHLMSRHISPLKNNSRNSIKMYHNSLRAINSDFYQHASMPCHLSPLKNNSENSKKYIFSN